MNQQRIKSALLSRCQCCLRERPTRELWSEHSIDDAMETYGVMLETLCRIPRPETEGGRICHPCIGRLKDAVYFQKQVQDAQSCLAELLNNEEADIENKLDGFLEGQMDITNKPALVKTDLNIEDPETTNYTEIEYLDVDSIDVGNTDTSKKGPGYMVWGDTVIKKIANKEPVVDLDDDNDDFSSPLSNISEVDEEPVEAPAPVTTSTKDNRTAVLSIVKMPNTASLINQKNEIAEVDAEPVEAPAPVTTSTKDNRTTVLSIVKMPNAASLIKRKNEIAKVDAEPAEAPAPVTTSTIDNRTTVTSASPSKLINIIKREIPKSSQKGYIPVKPEHNKNLQWRIERNKHQDNLSALLLWTNATPIKAKNDTGYRCGFCREIYVHARDLKTHTITCHEDEQKSKYLVNLEMSSLIVKLDVTDHRCNICGDPLDDYNSVWQHLKEHGIKVHLNLKNQIIPFKIQDNGIFNCFMCNADFAYLRALAVHMNVHINNYVCETCGSGFVLKRNMLLHARTHTQGDHKCPECDKHFSVKFKLATHIMRVHKHNKRVNNICGFCGKRFADSSNKERHLEKEHGVQRLHYKCDRCNKVLVSRKTLKGHIESVHMNLKNHQCPTCKKDFYKKTSMERHIRTKHVNKNNLACSVCNKNFMRLKLLKSHERMHEKDRNFVCGLCDDQFEKKSGLLSHLRARHRIANASSREFVANIHPDDDDGEDDSQPGLDYECLVCQERFHQKEKMMHHLNMMHGINNKNFEEFVNKVEVVENEDEE